MWFKSYAQAESFHFFVPKPEAGEGRRSRARHLSRVLRELRLKAEEQGGFVPGCPGRDMHEGWGARSGLRCRGGETPGVP